MTEQYEAAVRRVSAAARWNWTVKVTGRRKRIGAVISPGGAVEFGVPPGADPALLEHFVRSQAGAIGAKVGKQATNAPAEYPEKEFVGGEGFRWLGTNYRLRLHDQPSPLIDTGHVTSWSGHKIRELCMARQRPEAMRRLVIGWYQEHGLAWAQDKGARYEYAIKPGLRYEVRDIGRTRWALYDPRKHLIALHWTAFQLDARLVEEVLVHELAHATRPGGKPHGPQWRKRMDMWMWDWRQRESQLKEDGRRVWMGHLAPTIA